MDGDPIVELNGAGAGAVANGITITAGGTTVRGFVVNRFTRSGILLSTAGNNTVAGNYIGASASGTGSAANGGYGVEITGSAGNVIGGSATADRNVIAWNTLHGIYIDGTGGNNTIAGNYIGVNAAGAAAAPNRYGIWINSTSGNTIGGSAASQRNVISGNTWSSIRIETGGSNNTIRGNHIGTNASGNASLPNNLGINLMGSSGNTIGGTGAGEGNVISGNMNFGIQVAYEAASNVIQGNTIGLDPGRTVAIPNTAHGIAFTGGATPPYPTGNTVGGIGAGAGNVISGNGGSGVEVMKGTGNAILTNSIYGNGWIGIDLGNDNVTANDGAKTAGQPNLLMDFPVLTLPPSAARRSPSRGTSEAPRARRPSPARVWSSSSPTTIPAATGRGRPISGFLTSDANGNISGSLTVSGLAAGDRITGTATDGSNNTSEFGANVIVAAPGYQPDAMIKLASEGAGAYATDNVYEAAAATQVKSQGVVSASHGYLQSPLPERRERIGQPRHHPGRGGQLRGVHRPVPGQHVHGPDRRRDGGRVHDFRHGGGGGHDVDPPGHPPGNRQWRLPRLQGLRDGDLGGKRHEGGPGAGRHLVHLREPHAAQERRPGDRRPGPGHHVHGQRLERCRFNPRVGRSW